MPYDLRSYFVHNKSLGYESYAKCASNIHQQNHHHRRCRSILVVCWSCFGIFYNSLTVETRNFNRENLIRVNRVDFVDFFLGDECSWRHSLWNQVTSYSYFFNVLFFLLMPKVSTWKLKKTSKICKNKREMKLNRKERNLQRVYVNPKRTCWYFA